MSVHDYIINSEKATLKDDASGTLTLPITTGAVIPAGGSITFQTSVDIGSANSQISALMSSSLTGVKYAAAMLTIKMRITLSGSNFDSWEYVMIEKSSSGTVRLYCTIYNPYSSPITIIGNAQTITAEFVTYRSPFLP